MKRFKNILVGVDLSQDKALVSDELAPTTREALERAEWLAKLNGSRLTFVHVLPSSVLKLDEEAQALLAAPGQQSVLDHATEILGKMADDARGRGISAESRLVDGKGWVELIREVIRGNHDLVIVGARRRGPIKNIVLGSTAVKLLRKCPCPVWVTKPQPDAKIDAVLVAHDLRAVGDLAMDLGSSMAETFGSKLHVVHSAEYPEFDYMLPAIISREHAEQYQQNAKQRIASQLSNFNLAEPAQVHLVTEPPVFAILNLIKQHSIQLVVMGTVARAGIPGLITGNTAERLLPLLPCSVLAVKPTGFVSPIGLNH